MRVNHAGEIAAQGLYQGQAATAELPEVRAAMEQAAEEENDHLAWCEARLAELGSRPSVLGPLWYAGAFAIGAGAGLVGDRWSLGFVAETERQVVRHLEEHLGMLPADDARSRAILEQMKEDELAHGSAALEAGGAELPRPVKALMGLVSKLMTRGAYWV
jgi:ubiquinone biosynthesis monooxygenase Coq7